MIEQNISNLDAWLNTWKKDGGIQGMIVHHHKDMLECIFPDVLTQAGCILAHLNLYQKTGERKWLEQAESEGDFLCSIYLQKVHLFLLSSYEHKPRGATLVYNGFACYALLKLFNILNKEKYLNTAKDCIDNALTKKYWDTETKAFWDADNRHHTLNMGALAVAAVVELACATGDDSYVKDYAIPEAELILRYQEKNGFLKGAYHYDDSGGGIRYISLYIAWTMRGLIELYEYTGDKRYLESLKSAGDFLYGKMRDSKTGLFYHRYVKKHRLITELRPYPEWIAASGSMLCALKKLEKHQINYDLSENLAAVLKNQRKTGAFPNTVGYSNIFIPWVLKPEPEKKKWRDLIAVSGWNSLLLEALTEFLPENAKIPEPAIVFPDTVKTDDGYEIHESNWDIIIYKNTAPVGYYRKREPFIFNIMELATSDFTVRKTYERIFRFKLFVVSLIILIIGIIIGKYVQ